MDKAAYLQTIEETIQTGPYKDTWDSLSRFHVPAWYRDAKFGIFIHWGVYSVPAFSGSFGSDWYARNMYMEGSAEFEHHVKTYGPHKRFGYKDFIPLFKGEKFDPETWAALFQEAGARYVVPVAEHHDGFQMYRSELSRFNAYEMGPCRDVVGELRDALNRRGIAAGVSSHRVEHWFFMGHGKAFDSDIREPLVPGDLYWPSMPECDHQDLFGGPPSREYLEDWLLRCCEIVDRYMPRLIYFDWWIHHSAVKPYLKKFAAYYYNRAARNGLEGAICYKHDGFMFGCAVPDVERGQYADAKPFFWQTDTMTNRKSWGYAENRDYKSSRAILRDLVDIVSKNGCLLLNIGPKADGTIPEEEQGILLDIGKWLKVNGESVYGSKVWRKAAEGPTQVADGHFSDDGEKPFTAEDIRFTVNGSALYATVMQFPASGEVRVKSLAEGDPFKFNFHGVVKDVSILGQSQKPYWSRDHNGLKVIAPFCGGDWPVVLKILLD